MATAVSKEVYVLGEELDGNREVVVVNPGGEHDLPASAKYPYSNKLTRFPYELNP